MLQKGGRRHPFGPGQPCRPRPVENPHRTEATRGDAEAVPGQAVAASRVTGWETGFSRPMKLRLRVTSSTCVCW